MAHSSIEHPLARHFLTTLRDQSTMQSEYRTACNRITRLLAVEAARALPTRSFTIQTPLEECKGDTIEDPIVVIPILRAGLGMLQPFLDMFPTASVGYIGLERDETTATASEYYCKLPSLERAKVFLVDPMLATGGSAAKALEVLYKRKPNLNCTLVSILAAPQGLQKILKAYPDVTILTAAVDRELDENQYIRPGLGDFGDRLFGTS